MSRVRGQRSLVLCWALVRRERVRLWPSTSWRTQLASVLPALLAEIDGLLSPAPCVLDRARCAQRQSAPRDPLRHSRLVHTASVRQSHESDLTHSRVVRNALKHRDALVQRAAQSTAHLRRWPSSSAKVANRRTVPQSAAVRLWHERSRHRSFRRSIRRFHHCGASPV